jgi:thiopeptide-type bacteriocin biosynthesis protein
VPLDFVLVRAPLLPIETYQALSEPAAGDPIPPLLEDAQVRRALAVGSHALADALARGERGALTPRDAARLQAKLLRYLIRMSTRPTPYGLFAGVALGRWGDQTDVALAATAARTRTRPDMAWLWALVAKLEARPAVRQAVRLVANPAAILQAGRIVLTERAPPLEPGAGTGKGVSVRATGVVQRALARARTAVPHAELAAYLLDTTPGATPEKVEALLTELWQQTVLLTDLRPPLTSDSPARYVAQRLAGIPAAADVLEQLETVLAAAATWDGLPPDAGVAAYRPLVEQAARVAPAAKEDDALFQVDTALALRGAQLTHAVGIEAARAAELLLRLSPLPHGLPYLAAYRQSFLAKYGHERDVPLLELLDPQAGLGPPAWHAGSVDIPHARAMERAQTQRDLAMRALYRHQRVVELDPATLARLETWTPTPATAPPSLDLYAFVAAESVAALDAGAFQIIVGPNIGAPTAGRNLGRFADLLAPEGAAALGRAAAAEAASAPDQTWAELVYVPYRPRLANVVIRPPVRRYEIPLGVSPGVPADRVIPLGELVVGVREGRFTLRWPRAQAEVIVTAGHMLNNMGGPVVCRFLSDVSRDGQVQLSGFDWGPAEGTPFLPRVQAGRVVLRPAQWSVDGRVLPPEEPEAFARALDEWRAGWDVPRHVALSRGDNRLLLDLNDPRQVDELRTELRGLPPGNALPLLEVLPGLDQTWLPGPGGHYVTELVVSLVLREAAPRPGNGKAAGEAVPAGRPVVRVRDAAGADLLPVDRSQPTAMVPAQPPTPALPAWPAAPVDPAVRLRPPGSEWLFMKLYCPRPIEDDVIADPVRAFTEEALAAGWADEWFFIRYTDPDPHLRLRFRGAPDRLTGHLLPALCAWAAGLMAGGHCRHFSFDTYDREIERYGGPAGMEVAEAVFAADSRLVATVVQLLQDRVLLLDRTTVAVLSVDDLLAGLGLAAPERLRWYQEVVIARDQASAEYRRRKALLRALLGDPVRLPSEPEGAALSAALAARRAALAPFGPRLAALAEQGVLTETPAMLYRSFVHLHCNRLLGLSAGGEQTVLGLLLRTHEGLERAPHRV